MRFILCAALASIALPLIACGDDGGEEAFDNYQDCFEDHHNGDEGLTVQKAIVTCCLEHPIAGVTEVCGADATTCQTYLAANLDTASATSAEVMAACTDYVTQKDM